MPRTVLLSEFGGPEVLQLVDIETPLPEAGEVRIRVGAIGLNRVESHFRKGLYLPATFPSRIGLEAAGIVEAVGAGVTDVQPGDRVATLTGVSMERYGTYGEVILYPAEMVVKVAASQSLGEAAASWMQYVTAYGLIAVAKLSKGETVAITAASSSVGIAAIQIANDCGAVPIAITRGRDKATALLDAGAAGVIVSDEEDVGERLRELTAGVGVNVAFDAVAGPMLSTLTRAMAPQGILISYGLLGGLPTDFPFVQLMAGNLTLRGWSADMLTHDPSLRREVVHYIGDRLATGALRPVTDRQFDLDQIVDAHRHLESNRQFGKVIVATASLNE